LEIPALDFASKLQQFENWWVSATIGINWSICGDLSQNPRIAFIEKKDRKPAMEANDQLDENPAIGYLIAC
jgi:hypothetical protein